MATKKRKRNTPKDALAKQARVSIGSEPVAEATPEEQLIEADNAKLFGSWWGVLTILSVAIIYSYWPTLVWMYDAWLNEPDYSHGFFVPVLAAMVAWHRWDSFPGISPAARPVGLALLGLAIVMRIASRLLYMDFLDAYSLLPLVGGVVWVLLGPAAARWSLPAVLFLFFMIPLPFRMETMLSWKLQGIATSISTALLRIFGQPAVSEGHVIWMGEERLLVEQACSGLRIFVGVFALACFWASTVKRHWIDVVVIIACALPLAVVVNSLRITTVGLLFAWIGTEENHGAIHDWSGYLMIPAAFGLMWLVKFTWEHLYRPVELMTAKDFVRPAT